MPNAVEDPKNKENVPQGITITTPTRQEANTLNSPAQTKSLWDSSDPMRNPPPLPISPQMLRNSGGKTRGSTPTSPVGKLQFTAVDTTEIEYQLQKVLEAQLSLKTLLQGIDTSVKHTQLDLDNLQQRSANNNSHLKDLLENVSASAGPTTSFSSLSVEDLKKALSDSEKTLLLKISEVDNRMRDLREGMSKIATSSSIQTDPVLLKEIEEIKNRIDTIPRETNGEILKELQQTIDTHTQTSKQVLGLLSSNHGVLKESIKTTQEAVAGISIEPHITSLKESQTWLGKEIKSQIESVSNNRSTDGMEKSHAYLADIAEEIKSLKEDSKKSLHTLTNQPDVSERLCSLEPLISNAIAAEHTKLNEGLAGHLERIEHSHQDVLDKSTSIQETHTKFTEQLRPELDSIMSSVKNFSELLSSRSISASSELEKKDMELSLKDKEIAELKAQLEEEKNKHAISSTILELTEEKTKLETKLEGLHEVYKARYEDLRSLSKEHEELNTRWLEFNTGKLKSITSTAAFTQITLPQESKAESLSYKKSSTVGSRVLSTNSYLSNRRSTLSPKPRKVYDLEPIEGEDEKEKENL